MSSEEGVGYGTELNSSAREALAMFADELSAHRYLERLLWPDGVCCPRCGNAKVGRLERRVDSFGHLKCYSCRKAVLLLHGTMMRSSHVPAHKWLQAVYLTDGGTKPMRSYHLHRILNVSLKTASSMMRRIGEAAGSLSPASTAKGAVTRRTDAFASRQASPRRFCGNRRFGRHGRTWHLLSGLPSRS